MSGLVDTHCHLMDRAFDADRPQVLERTAQAGVAALVLVGYDLRSSRAALDLARQLPNAVATVGIHPNSAGAASPLEFEAIKDLLDDPLVVGIGETGLDYFRDRTPHDVQQRAFEWHLRLAEERGLPAIVHTRDAHADVATALEASAARRPSTQIAGVLHCFSGDAAHAQRMLAAGYYISFAGPLTYRNSGLPAVAEVVPLDRLLVETDCPYLPPASHRGQRNEPAYLAETFRFLVRLIEQDLRDQLWSNSLRVFPALARAEQVAA
ncbi:MAG TPA: TatD family hydrolase [Chloroflexota bacterium]